MNYEHDIPAYAPWPLVLSNFAIFIRTGGRLSVLRRPEIATTLEGHRDGRREP
jgi:hypothetical protein